MYNEGMRNRVPGWVAIVGLGAVLSIAAPSEAREKTPSLSELAKEFPTLAPAAQIALLRALREFVGEYEGVLEHAEASKDREEVKELLASWARIFGEQSASALEGANCLYAGWPSKLVDKVCASPASTNPDYAKLFKDAGCDSARGGLLCSPAIFGAKACVGPSQGLSMKADGKVDWALTVNSSYQRCLKTYRTRGLAEVAKHVATDTKAMALLQETSSLVDHVCKVDSKAKTAGMCAHITTRMAAIWTEFAGQYQDQPAVDHCYAKLAALAGMSAEEIAKADFLKNGTSYDAHYKGALNEVVTRLKALTTEVKPQMDEARRKAFRDGLSEAFQQHALSKDGGCGDIKNPDVVALRGEACKALALPPGGGCPGEVTPAASSSGADSGGFNSGAEPPR
jgi:hypothetical protein